MDDDVSGRTCTGCGVAQPPEAFGWKDRAAGRRRARCRACTQAYNATWYAGRAEKHRLLNARARAARRRRNQALVERLKSVPCADCDRTFRPEVMDFDHVRGRKRVDIASALWHLGQEALLAEMAKCDVVCAMCHRVRTVQRMSAARRRNDASSEGRHGSG